MRYWNDMQDKYGFSDGATVPEGAALYRQAYILAVNTLATTLHSTVRAFAVDRTGLHNWCLIAFVPTEASANWSSELFVSGDAEFGTLVHVDQAMIQAIQAAMAMNVDQYVTVRTSLNRQKMKELVRIANAYTPEVTQDAS